MVIEDLVNLKEDSVSAEEAIDVEKKKKKGRCTEAIDFSEQYHISETTKMEAEN